MSANAFIPTRRSLLSRLKDWNDQVSWQDFFDTYWKLIYSVARQSGLHDAEAQDVVQEVILVVAKKMPAFKYDPAIGSFKSWLLLITRRRITDHLRQCRREPAMQGHEHKSATETTGTATLERMPDPSSFNLEAVWEQEWQKNLLEAAVKKVQRQVDPKQFQIFDCYVLKQWPVNQVAKTLGVTTNQVYLAKNRVGEMVQKAIKELETKIV